MCGILNKEFETRVTLLLLGFFFFKVKKPQLVAKRYLMKLTRN